MNVLTIEQRKNRIIWLSRLITIIGFVFIIFIPMAFAKNENTTEVAWAEQILNGVAQTVKETYDNFKDITEDAIFDSFADVLKFLGAAWVIVAAAVRMFQTIEKGQDVMESLFRFIFEISCTLMIINCIGDIIKWIDTDLSAVLIDAVLKNPDDMSAKFTAESLLKSLTGKETGDWKWRLATDIKLLIPYALSYIVKLAAKFAVIQLFFELGIRRAFAPMAVADIYQEGLRSPGFRYLKRYFAVYVKIAICIVLARLTGTLINNLSGANASNYIFEVIAINFSCVGVMFKGGEYANDIVGA